MFCGQLPKLRGNVEGLIYICNNIAVPVNNTRVLRYVILMTRAATGSRFVCQLLHTGHYAAPLKHVT